MQIETLRDAWTHSVRITMRCAWGKRDAMKSIRECQFSAELDVRTLVCTRGPNFPIDQLASRLMCPRCRSRKVRLLISLPTNTSSMRRHGGAAQL